MTAHTSVVGETTYEPRMAEAPKMPRADYATGRYYSLRDELMAAVAKKHAALSISAIFEKTDAHRSVDKTENMSK